MSDPKIKLFGKTIQLPENSAADETGDPGPPRSASNQDPPSSSDSMLEDTNFFSGDAEDHQSLKSPSLPEQDQSKEEDGPGPLTPDEPKDPNTTTQPVVTNGPSTPADCDASVKDSKTEEDQMDQNGKTLKKPDKILPCPRCNSMDTKFCYFNNYNVNQPRHFCKNCQRYWTAGGTMRNVPVGAGRRKTKNTSVSQFRHLAVPESLQPNGIHHPASLSPNGTVLTFGSDSPLCESITSVLNIVDQTIRNGPKNGLHRPEDMDNGPSRSSITSTDESPVRICNPVPPQVPCYPEPPWAYPWNPVQWAPGSFPMPFYSAAAPPPYWGWNVPWVIPPTPHAPFGPNSPTLGKHSREDTLKEDGESVKVSNPEKCLWVPKTLRIDDPGEAAKSSIWATLGIKKDGVDSDGMFKAFRSEGKADAKGSSHVTETSTVLQANPAAMSMSLSFHESS